jgi:hypothetical protein
MSESEAKSLGQQDSPVLEDAIEDSYETEFGFLPGLHRT